MGAEGSVEGAVSQRTVRRLIDAKDLGRHGEHAWDVSLDRVFLPSGYA